MPPLLFYLFVLITLGFGLNVVIARNPVTSALSLAVSFVGLASLFLSLDAYFIGVLQVLVYAGAVMVLFLFIIMLMDIKSEEAGGRANMAAIIAGVVVAGILSVQVATISGKLPFSDKSTETAALKLAEAGAQWEAKGKENLPTISRDLKAGELPDAKLMGETLFSKYAFHLQVVGLLLLVSTVGVVALSKRDNKEASSQS
ncbi:NADH-quinone oxidoreductase subunit J family protein [Brevifollis gellanilyticus]|uniref:NADH-quinone oxidoreductase subunit J n=1 Tax=Brevifollis gellanilyticus TaxID=748831 RepID=A0A512MBB4_9BACT|nr:NADH-quinone oxidoreductase subunit J [Brevifollis gellanilyticus]GEP44025.1 NADH dehydrogenase [Brevifollis gellanilyticus]